MRKAVLLTSIFVIMIIMSGCMDKKVQTTNPQNQGTADKVNTVDKQNNNTNPPIVETDERPVVVMIDNEGIATKRQSGLDKAYIVYEIVAEGGETRLMALFKGTNPETIGPVRSTRDYFIYYALEHDPIYVHFGWSPLAEKAIHSLKVNNINGIMGVDGAIFWRNPNKKGDWQNAFTSMKKIKEMAARKKYKDTTAVKVFSYSPAELELTGGQNASNLKIQYSSQKIINYQYDEANKNYKRAVGNKPHTDAVSKVQYTAKNIIIEHVKNYLLKDVEKKGRQQLDIVGTGKGYFITDGKCIQITWKKSGNTAKSEYRDMQGNEILLNMGQTWIQVAPVGAKVTFE